jgi:UDP-N-acetylmuramoyl-L-alanyl-D-glutamate--2,6-diaminopimelate ligase
MLLTTLLAALPTCVPSTTEVVEITAITADSRAVRPGALFVAYRGVAQDGHQFIPQAIRQGAAAIVAEEAAVVAEDEAYTLSAPSPPCILVPDGREALAYLAAAWHNFPARRMAMAGVTGTDGKTTTTNYLYQMLQAGGKKSGMVSTIWATIGAARIDTGLHTTTPDALQTQSLLAQMVAAGSEACVLEVTSHGLAHHRVTACDFDVAIVTNITHEHLDLHGSRDAYRAAKASLFESLATAADKGHPKRAILNCDDDSFEYLQRKLAPAKIPWIGYSLAGHPAAAVTAHDIIPRPDGTRFTLRYSGGDFEVETALVGDYNVSNCLAAATAALECFGLSQAHVRQGAAALTGLPGRMERIDEGQPFTAMVDFAHTPHALRRALTTARTLTTGRVLAVFGCAGERDVEKRVLMGQVAAELADFTLITAEDPRRESLAAIIAETAQAMQAAGAVEGRQFERVPDRGQALARAVQLARPGDVVIAFGKGHEQSMCFGLTEYPWDDRHAMRAALRGQPLRTLPTAAQI